MVDSSGHLSEISMSFMIARRILIALLLASPFPALAKFDSMMDAANLRAGPDRAFPVVSWLPARTQIAVVGCIEGGQWCDVVVGRRRGFVHSRYIAPRFSHRGVPVVTFNVKDYWEAHYQRQSWFRSYVDWVDFGKPGFVVPNASARRGSP